MRIGTVKQVWRYPVKSMGGEQLEDCTLGSQGIPGDRGWALRDETSKEITNAKRLPVLMQCSAKYLDPPTSEFIPNVEIRFPDGTVAHSDDSDINQKLSELVAKPVSLWPLQPASNIEHYRLHSKSARVIGSLSKYRAFRALLPTLTSFGRANAELREAFSREPHEPIPDVSVLPPEVLEFTSPPGTYFDAFPIHVLTTASLNAMARLNPNAQWEVRRFRPNFLIETESKFKSLIESEWNGQRLRVGSALLQCDIPTMRCGMTMNAQEGLPKDPSILRSIVRDADQNLGVYARVATPGEVRLGEVAELV
jgi:uncharacterized protein YcbX